MKRVACFQCEPEDINVQVCGRCRELTKHDIALMLREEVPIYLNALNRNRKGRKSKLTATQKSDLAAEHRYKGTSFRDLGEKHGISGSTACRTYHKEYDNVRFSD